MELNKLSEMLLVLESTFGIDVCLAEANKVYSGVYKSAESFTLADTLSVNDPSQATEIRLEYRDIVAESLAIANGTYQPLSQDEMEFGYDEDRSGISAMYSTADKLLDNGIRFVMLCNYKGEDAGIMLDELSQGVRTYVGKYNYI